MGMNHSFRLYARGGYFTGQPVFNTSASSKDPLWQCLRLGWPTAEEGHYTHKQVNDDLGQDFVAAILEQLLDFSHLFFKQEEV